MNIEAEPHPEHVMRCTCELRERLSTESIYTWLRKWCCNRERGVVAEVKNLFQLPAHRCCS